MKISVITVAYKSADILEKSIRSIFQYNDIGDDLEYILVDNSPIEDRVNKRLSKEILDQIIYIPADNKGFGAGNNKGAAVAKGEILAFINPDIILIEPIFKSICHEFDINENMAMMGCKLLYEDLASGFSFYFDYKYSVLKKWTLKLWNKLNYFDSNSMYLSGADMFIRKSVFQKCGRFDENIFMYYEEPDITRRIKKSCNGDVLFNKSIKMIHLEKKSTPNTLNSVKYEFDSAIYYGKKYKLNYKRKVEFEIWYYKLKFIFYSLINSSKKEVLKQIIFFLDNNY